MALQELKAKNFKITDETIRATLEALVLDVQHIHHATSQR